MQSTITEWKVHCSPLHYQFEYVSITDEFHRKNFKQSFALTPGLTVGTLLSMVSYTEQGCMEDEVPCELKDRIVKANLAFHSRKLITFLLKNYVCKAQYKSILTSSFVSSLTSAYTVRSFVSLPGYKWKNQVNYYNMTQYYKAKKWYNQEFLTNMSFFAATNSHNYTDYNDNDETSTSYAHNKEVFYCKWWNCLC